MVVFKWKHNLKKYELRRAFACHPHSCKAEEWSMFWSTAVWSVLTATWLKGWRVVVVLIHSRLKCPYSHMAVRLESGRCTGPQPSEVSQQPHGWKAGEWSLYWSPAVWSVLTATWLKGCRAAATVIHSYLNSVCEEYFICL